MTQEAKTGNRIRSFDGLRFWIVIFLIFHHFDAFNDLNVPGWEQFMRFFNEGYLSVNFFFVLSGFVVSMGYREKLRQGLLSDRKFILARLFHLYPTHFLCLIAALLLYGGQNWPYLIKTPQFITNLCLVHAWIPDMSYAFSYNVLAWSVSAEFFFYLCFLFLVQLPQKYRTKLLLFLWGLIFLMAYIGQTVENIGWFLYINPAFRLGDFLLGMELYSLYQKEFFKPATKRGATVLECAAVVVLAAAVIIAASANISWVWRWQILYTLPVAFLIYAFSFDLGYLSDLLGCRVFSALGKIAFPLYLTHQMVLNVLKQAYLDTLVSCSAVLKVGLLAILISILLSALIEYFYAEPINQALKHRLYAPAAQEPPTDGDSASSRPSGTSRWEKCFVVFLAICLCFPAVNTLLFKKDAPPLSGVENERTFPVFSLAAFRDGSFQSQFEDAFSHGFGGYRALIRIYNELRYRLFHEADNVVLLKDDSAVFSYYLEEYLGLNTDYYCTDDALDELVSQIERLNDLAQQQGKTLAVLITPNKVAFCSEQIPEKYLNMPREYSVADRSVERLTARLAQTDIPYVSGSAILRAQELPCDIFPKTGIHWTREAALTVFDGLEDVLEAEGFCLKRVAVDGRESEFQPRPISKNSDADIWLNMNLISEPDAAYTYPIEREIVPDGYQLPAVFIQGGSFGLTFSEIMTDHHIVRDVNYLFYDMNYFDSSMEAQSFSGLDDAAIAQKVAESDIILLEVNEAAIVGMGSGFYPVLEQMLGGTAAQSTDASDALAVFYSDIGPEESYQGVTWRWAWGEHAALIFRNAGSSAIEVQYWVPYSAYCASNPAVPASIDVSLLLNGEEFERVSCHEDTIFTTVIPAEKLRTDRDNLVEIKTSFTFPGETASGAKDLAYQVLYAGRAR